MRCHSKSAGILCPSTRPLSAPCVFSFHRQTIFPARGQVTEPSAVSAAAGRPVPDNPTQEPCHVGEKIVESPMYASQPFPGRRMLPELVHRGRLLVGRIALLPHPT